MRVNPVRSRAAAATLDGRTSSATVATLFGLILLLSLLTVIVSMFAPALRALVAKAALPLAATVASGAMLGSIYFSEIADFVPCKLCWYQRIAMYPLAVLLTIATIYRDRAIFRYVTVIAALGLSVSVYHVWIQWFPEDSNFCEISNPCSAKWIEALGAITIPQMAAVSFILIIVIIES